MHSGPLQEPSFLHAKFTSQCCLLLKKFPKLLTWALSHLRTQLYLQLVTMAHPHKHSCSLYRPCRQVWGRDVRHRAVADQKWVLVSSLQQSISRDLLSKAPYVQKTTYFPSSLCHPVLCSKDELKSYRNLCQFRYCNSHIV